MGLKGTIAASVVSLTAGVVIGYIVRSSNDEVELPVFGKETPIQSEVFHDSDKPVLNKENKSHTIENFDIIKQLPELPTGCEVTSLTMVLNYLGYDADKMQISRRYLEKEPLEVGYDNVLRGPDFRFVFPGDPENESSFGCMAPCIASAAGKYIDDHDGNMVPVNLTGTEFSDLFGYIDNDMPVIIWSTLGLAAPEYNLSWITDSGEEVSWPTNEHCVVLSAYDQDNNTVRIHDPINGIITLNMNAVNERYDQIGKNAVVIIKNN